MRIRASFTIENAVIIPIFTWIVVSLIALSLYLHDCVVIKDALFQGAVVLEKAGDNAVQVREVQERVQDYIYGKAAAVGRPQVILEVTDTEIRAECRTVFLLAGVLKNNSQIHKTERVKTSYPPDYIRKIRSAERILAK